MTMTEQEIQQKLARLAQLEKDYEKLEKANRKRLEKAREASKRRHKAKVDAGLKRISVYVPADIIKEMHEAGKVISTVVWAPPSGQNYVRTQKIEAYKKEDGKWYLRWL